MAGLIFVIYYIVSGTLIGLAMATWGDPSGAVILGVFMPFAGLMLLFIFVLIIGILNGEF